LVVVAGVLVYHFLGPELRYRFGLAGAPLPRKADALRVVTWNLRHFEGDPEKHDLDRLVDQLEALDADIVAVQEIEDPGALAELLPRWELAISEHGGRGHQKVGVLYDPATVEALDEPREHRRLTMKGRVRPGYSLHLRGREAGPDLFVFVVHLKAMPKGHALRREQWRLLQAELRPLVERDGDVIVLGDFNATGPEGGEARDELEALERSLAAIDLRRVRVEGGCTAYWDGPRRDAWKEPSLLDLIFVRDLSESLHAPVAYPAGHCQRHACDSFRSTDAYPDPDFERVSDHCPVAIDLLRRDDD
jgi:endonuclease/exonuclease/phosphatase family metal-dependent hydrolase